MYEVDIFEWGNVRLRCYTILWKHYVSSVEEADYYSDALIEPMGGVLVAVGTDRIHDGMGGMVLIPISGRGSMRRSCIGR